MHHASPATYLAIEEPLELDAESVGAEKNIFRCDFFYLRFLWKCKRSDIITRNARDLKRNLFGIELKPH